MATRIRLGSRTSPKSPPPEDEDQEERPRRNRRESRSSEESQKKEPKRKPRSPSPEDEDQEEERPRRNRRESRSSEESQKEEPKPNPISPSPEDEDQEERPRRNRRESRSSEESQKKEPKRKSSTTIRLGSKVKEPDEKKEDNTNKEEDNKENQRSTADEPPEDEPNKSKQHTKRKEEEEIPSLTNGHVSKGDDLSYDESYKLAKEMYGEPPPINTKALPRMQKVRSKSESWPPTEVQDNDKFAVEGYGLTDPYTNKIIEKKPDGPKYAQQTPHRDTTHYDTSRQKVIPQEPSYTNPALAPHERVEIVDDHVKPVAQLKRQWNYKPQPKVPGVNRPSTHVKDEDSWIKHVKAPIEYDKPQEEPSWKQLVRNRRWKSTIRARFPSKDEEVIEFERRSTTPKNWNRLLKDKKSVRVIGAITGIGAEGEELLWRLASRRDKIESTTRSDYETYQPKQPSETLAYEHMKDNLEAAVYACLEGGEKGYAVDDDSDVASIAESVPSIRSSKGKLSRSNSISSETGSPKLRRRPQRLAPEEFKKQVALEKSRDATLRWQFSADPYDSVHENQLLPFELAVLYGEKDRRLRNLFRKLVKPEDLPDSAFSSPPGTPRRRSPYYDSEPEIDGDYYGAVDQSRGRQTRPKKRVPPPPPPRRGRSASPSMRNRMRDYNDLRFLPQDLVLSDDLKDEIKKLDELSQQLKDDADRHPAVHDTTARIESGDMEQTGTRYDKDTPDEFIKTGLAERKQSFLKEAQKEADEEKIRAERTADINKREIKARRDRFVEKDRQSMNESETEEKPERRRRRVQRMKSDADLHEVFRKRREATDVNIVGDDQTEASGEMKQLVSDIQDKFGNEEQSR